jgi:hypothetical protein
MTLTFPESPTIGQRTTTGGRTYEWNGEAWDLVGGGFAGPQGPLGPTGPNGGVFADVPFNSLIYGRRNGTWVDVAGEANLQVRRGTAAEVAAITPEVGEPVWATDTKRLYVGDGSVTGGMPVGNYPLVGQSAVNVGGATGVRTGTVFVASDLDRSSIVVPGATFVAGGTRGFGSFDLTTVRTTATQVASGEFAFAGPGTNTAAGLYSVAIGNATGTAANVFAYGGTASASKATAFHGTASATNAIAFHGTADAAGTMAHGAVTNLNSSIGRGQAVQVGFRWQTSNATPAILRREGSVAGYPIPSGVALFGTVQVCAIQASTGVEACHYVRKFAIKNTGGTTALIGTPSTVGTDEETDAGLDVLLEANDTTDTLDIKVTGLASTTLRWIAIVSGVEQAF